MTCNLLCDVFVVTVYVTAWEFTRPNVTVGQTLLSTYFLGPLKSFWTPEYR